MTALLSDGGANARAQIAARGFAWLPRATWSVGPGLEAGLQAGLEALRSDYDALEPDRYLAGGATFRRRRYGSCLWTPADDTLTQRPDTPYFQPADQNAYAGGVARQFGPVRAVTVHNPFVRSLVNACFACLPIPEAWRRDSWEVHMHQIRIIATAAAPGLPTPEGIHQDGTDFHTLHLLRRDAVDGAQTTIYSLDRAPLFDCTMREVLDTLILEDPRIMHAVTPLVVAEGAATGCRDIFGIDYYHRPGAGVRVPPIEHNDGRR